MVEIFSILATGEQMDEEITFWLGSRSVVDGPLS